MNARTTSHPQSDGQSEAGFSVVEVLLSGIILTVAVLGSINGIVYSTALNETNKENARAILMARAMVEKTMSVPFDEVFAEFNSDPSDDPAGVDSATGNVMESCELLNHSSSAKVLTGTIEFPLDESGVLIETSDKPEFGLPLDLNGDGETDATDRRTDYRLLPMKVKVEWKGHNGNQRWVEFFTMLRR